MSLPLYVQKRTIARVGLFLSISIFGFLLFRDIYLLFFDKYLLQNDYICVTIQKKKGIDMQKFLLYFTQTLLYITLLVIIALTVCLPWVFNYYLKWSFDGINGLANNRIFLMAFLYMLGISGVWLIFELLSIMRTVQSDPFVTRNVKSLRRISIIGMFTAILFFIKCIIFFTPFTLICGIVLFFCSLFALVLLQVIRQAIIYKQEIDLTI